MNALLFGGNSKNNQTWIHEVDEHLRDLFDATYVQDYAHWQTGDESINLEVELSKAEEAAATREPYVIFAKSIGSILSLKGIHEQRLSPQKCFFVGLPLALIEREQLPAVDWLKRCLISILIGQNDHDPIGSFMALKSFVEQSGARSYQVVELQGETHGYENYSRLHELAEQFIGV